MQENFWKTEWSNLFDIRFLPFFAKILRENIR